MARAPALALTLCLVATPAAADRLVPEENVTSLKVGVPAPFTVRRVGDDGGMPTTTNFVAVTITAMSPAVVRNSATSVGAPSQTANILAGTDVSTRRWLSTPQTSGTAMFTVTTTPLGTLMVPVSIDPLPVQDDFESGPSPLWSYALLVPGEAFDVVSSAAHRGDAGIRLTDTDVSGGASNGSCLGADVDLLRLPEYFVRTWFRFESPGGNNSVVVAQVDQSCNGAAAASLYAQPQLSTFAIGAFSTDGGFYFDGTLPSLARGVWQLLDLQVRGMSSDAGTVRLFVNGVERGNIDLDYSGCAFAGVRFGEVYSSNSTETPVFSFDDVRTGHLPHPTFIRSSFLGPLVAGQCVPALVTLADVQLAPAFAPYSVALALASSNGTAHSAPDCNSTPLTVLTVPTGQTAAGFFFRPAAAGALDFSATHLDFLSSNAIPLTVAAYDGGTPDAGRPDAGPVDAGPPDSGAPDAGFDGGLDAGDAQVLITGCGCGAGGDGLAFAALALVLLGRRRKQVPTGAELFQPLGLPRLLGPLPSVMATVGTAVPLQRRRNG